MNKYIERVLADTKAKNANEPEFTPSMRRSLCWSAWWSPSAPSSSA